MRVERLRSTQFLLAVAAVMIVQLMSTGVRVGNAVSQAETSTPTATATPTATVPAGTVTPVPLGSWANWPERPTDQLFLDDIQLHDAYFPSRDEGWAVGFGTKGRETDVAIILHYQDGEWTVDEGLSEIEREEMRLRAIDGAGPDNIWAVGKDHHPLLDTDVAVLVHYDGEAWTKLDVEPLRAAGLSPLDDVDMVMGDNGPEAWAVGRRGYVLHYDPVEGTWAEQTRLGDLDLLTISMANATDGWIISEREGDGRGRHHWYHNGSWIAGSIWGVWSFAVSMADPHYGWSVGPGGAVFEYIGTCHDPDPRVYCTWNAGGITVDGRSLGLDLHDVQLLSRYDGWVVGKDRDSVSSVFHFQRLSRDLDDSRHNSWRPMTVENDPGDALYGVYMLPGPEGWAIDGWAVGEDGVILRYEGPAPAATATTTPTATATPTGTATATATVTLTPTPSATPTSSPTPSPTPAESPEGWRIYVSFLARNRS